MKAYERLLKYITFHTPSDESSSSSPSSACQFELAQYLVDELHSLGISDAYVDEHCYVYAHIPATVGREYSTPIGFLAHMDTVSDFCHHCPNPQIIEKYDGKDIPLSNSGLVIKVDDFPHLSRLTGHTLITTDGTTILGSDDKSGIAEIMTAVERMNGIDHGPISICFTPDEEIGRGTDFFRPEEFRAKYAFTLDGEAAGEVQYETFNAAAARVHITGNNIHPGSAKNIMINAALVGMEYNELLPSAERPEYTEIYEGFIHLTHISGDVSSAEMTYILRDHDSNKLLSKKDTMLLAAKLINEKYGEGTIDICIEDQYQNMANILKDYPDILSKAKAACIECGIDPIVAPIRGATDGAILSYRGIPCPNLGTGGYAFHGPYEHASIQEMDKIVEIILTIIKQFSK